MAEIEMVNEGGMRTVVIKGQMTIEYASALRRALQQSLEDAERVNLDLRNVTEIDLSGLQVLCSVHRTSVHLKKPLKLTNERPEVIEHAARRSGYRRYSGCMKETEKSCLWIIED